MALFKVNHTLNHDGIIANEAGDLRPPFVKRTTDYL